MAHALPHRRNEVAVSTSASRARGAALIRRTPPNKPRSRPWSARTVTLLAVGGLLTGGLTAAAPGAGATGVAVPTPAPAPTTVQAAPNPDQVLGTSDEQKLRDAEHDGTRTVTILVTTTEGETAKVEADLRALGGYIRYAAPKLGYLSAVVPTSRVDKAAKLRHVRAVDLDEAVPLPEPAPDATAGKVTATAAVSAPDADTPDDNPYLPTRDTGSIEFKRDHPTWDGRGVTIGILDSGVDLDNPALQTTSTGERKIVDWFTATDPVTEGSLVAGGDATWLPMATDATGPLFPATGTYRGAQWKLPAGTFKIRTLDEAQTKVDPSDCEVCGDVNRDGDTTDRIGVLYDPQSHAIRVDTNDNKDFTDETAMGRYRDTHQVGHLGRDNPATGIHEAMPFVVDYREDVSLKPLGLDQSVDFVDIGLTSGAHGSHVAGITAAWHLFGGAMNGQAPGAKLVSARGCSFGPSCTAAALSDGMAELAANRGVDIINMSIGGLPALNDGANARADLYNRIINDLGVQIVISAGNSSSALNTVGDPSVADDVVSVGADITRQTWLANYGSKVAFGEGMLPFSSGGPREDGGFKPDITAPGAAISTVPMWQAGQPVAESGYSLPAGYAMFQGTSMASPQATGAMALLLSAAKQAGVEKRSPAALRRAVYTQALYNYSVPAFLQGYGQINVPRSWSLLKRGLDDSRITTKAPVCTTIWQILGETEGTGLYNRCAPGAGGQAPGESKTYPVTLTRTTGPADSGVYQLRLKGNDGTFKVSPNHVALPLNQPVTVQVTATPEAGAHSVSMLIDDPRTDGLDGAMMAVVAAGASYTGPEFTQVERSKVDRNEAKRYYVTVPPGAKALEVSMSGLEDDSQTRFLVFHPYGVPLDNTSTPNCYPHYGNPPGNGCNPSVRSYANPTPGVWEILVEARRTSPVLVNSFKLTTKLLGAKITPAVVSLPSATSGRPTPVQWTAVNEFAPVNAHAVGGPLGSARVERPSISTGQTKQYTVDVPAGATRLDVSIGNTEDKAADLDLYVTGPSGPKQSADGDSEEAVSYQNPQPGTYTVTVDGYSVPAGTTAFDYVDVFYSPDLGTLAVDGTPFDFGPGASKVISGTLTAKSSSVQGRQLFGEMNLLSASGALLGTGQVRIGAVAAG
jgi:hypothetical protein